MTTRRMTPEEIERACALREGGAKISAIANALNVSPGAVSWQCLRHGADAPNAKLLLQDPSGPSTYQRNGHAVRRFSKEDDAIIAMLETEGKNPTDISRALGRRNNSIIGRQMTLARREERVARFAEAKQLARSENFYA